MQNLIFLIITGMSGAGKSQASKVFEDIGYFCVDNLPAPLLSRFAELILQNDGTLNKVCLVIDSRGGVFTAGLNAALEELREMDIRYDILFFDASDEVLTNRFKELRRSHPLRPDGSILEGIQEERAQLRELRGMASKIIDTSRLSAKDLRREILETWSCGAHDMTVRLQSFGYKFGVPIDADIVMDCRFLENPYYVAELRPLTGRDQAVQDFVFSFEEAQQFIDRFSDMILTLLPMYISQGKAHLSIAMGCTGGQHRSVTMAIALEQRLADAGYNVILKHRDH